MGRDEPLISSMAPQLPAANMSPTTPLFKVETKTELIIPVRNLSGIRVPMRRSTTDRSIDSSKDSIISPLKRSLAGNISPVKSSVRNDESPSAKM